MFLRKTSIFPATDIFQSDEINGLGPILAYSLKQFVHESEAIVRKSSSESEILLHLRSMLEKLVQTPDSVPPETFAPRKDRFAMNLLHMPQDKGYSIIGGVWK